MDALSGFIPHWADWGNTDPNQIVVEDPSATVLAELPTGDYDLKTYRISQAVLNEYARLFSVAGADVKDNGKAPDCTRAEIHALQQWTTNFIYTEVNHALRLAQKGKVNGVLISPKVEIEILMIASAVNCAPQWEGLAVRMENTPPVILNQYQEGYHILARGFTSTTKGKDPNPHFVPISKQKIFYTNARGADVDALGIASFPAEREVLIRPGTVFKVISRVDHDPFSKLTNEFVFEQK